MTVFTKSSNNIQHVQLLGKLHSGKEANFSSPQSDVPQQHFLAINCPQKQIINTSDQSAVPQGYDIKL